MTVPFPNRQPLLNLGAVLSLTLGSGHAQTRPATPELTLLGAHPVLSGVINEPSRTRTITVMNKGAAEVTITALTLPGETGKFFELVGAPTLPVTLKAGENLSVQVRLASNSQVGVVSGTLEVKTVASSLQVPLGGLRARGLEGDKEPPLALIVEALGYQTDLGTTALLLGTQPAPVGAEVIAPLFQKTSSGPVKLRPVARYSPAGPSPYGYFLPGKSGQNPELRPLGDILSRDHQALNPELQGGSHTTFDPGNSTFGIYLAPNEYASTTTYSLDALNKGKLSHAMRVFPLRTLNGEAVPGTYLIAVEPSSNGDYQDVVFIIENVRPATP